MKAPSVIGELTERFERNREAYHSPKYNETQLRREFVDPFFEALEWDVENKQGLAEQYKDVIHEDAIKVGGGTKAPDYCFRVGGTRKFFVEAKKPAVKLKEDPTPAFQLRRYAWSAKLPLSILTDFEEFAVYDCRIRPHKTDKASAHRVMFFTFEEYLDRWDEIAGVFSHEEVLKGSFDKYAESKRRRGTAEVDDAFLSEIEAWRKELAQNLALRNKGLTQRQLNFAVARTIDRIIFLRVCEDRGIEPYGQLQALLDAQNLYPRLFEIFYQADVRYNSGLFHFRKETGRAEDPDELTPKLKLDDKRLKDIIRGLYYPESPYEFSVLPADILGQVYEQFLGKVIRLTAGHQAKVEDKPEVKKAGGVYYTPTYIVDYIVKHTVGKLLEGKTPKQAAKLRILDPACGSGSFLIGAYQHLLDWHRDWYADHEPKKHHKEVYQAARGEWRLTTAERKRILLNNIYGVDIDPQAVEVTKLSLLLKVLEGESRDTLESQLRMFRERALPDLSSNIKCGNSLIGPDFYDHAQMELLDDEEKYRINAFDWQTEFADIMKAGGFDAVIGNPPYLKIEHIDEDDRSYFTQKFTSFMRRFDTYGLFIERAISLLRMKGLYGMIIPSTVLNNMSFRNLRKLILEETAVQTIVNLGGKVFSGVTNDTLILVFARGYEPNTLTSVFDVQKYGRGLLSAALISERDLTKTAMAPTYALELRMTDEADSVISKAQKDNPSLGEICSCFQGFVTGGNEAYIVDATSIREKQLEEKVCKPAVFGDNVPRYGVPVAQTFVIYVTKDTPLDHYTNIKAHLLPFKQKLERKREVKLGRQPWHCLHWPRSQRNFERSPKILVQAIRNLSLRRRVIATLDAQRLYADHTLNVLYLKEYQPYGINYILGILNSTLVNFIFRKKYIDINIKGIYLTALPIYPIDFSDKEDKARHDKMVVLVERMLELNRELPKAKTPDEKTRLERQIAATDRQIDGLVYELYGLTEDEIKIVEGE